MRLTSEFTVSIQFGVYLTVVEGFGGDSDTPMRQSLLFRKGLEERRKTAGYGSAGTGHASFLDVARLGLTKSREEGDFRLGKDMDL
jgi:hypothetical protein